MKLKDVRGIYDTYSGTASDNVRRLGFAAIALIWVFRTESGGQITIPPQLVEAICFVFVALAADFLQYAYAAFVWGWVGRNREAKLKREHGEAAAVSEKEIQAPITFINWPTIACFWGKIGLMAIAYAWIIRFLNGWSSI